MSNDNKSGTVFQRTWWRIRDLYHQLKPCRFSLIVALIALPVFVCVAQGTEILRTVGKGTAIGGQWEWVRVFVFFLALILCATTSWHAARVLLYFGFPAQRGVTSSKFDETQVPRILGIVPILIVGWDRWRRVDRDRPNGVGVLSGIRTFFRRTQQLDQFRRLC